MRRINGRNRLVVLNACAGLAVEILNAATSRLAGAFAARQDSNAYNIEAGIGRLTAAENAMTRAGHAGSGRISDPA